MSNVSKCYHPKFEVVKELVDVLYNLPGCSDGGLCRRVVSSKCLNSVSLDYVIAECNKKENADKIDCELSKAICEILKQMTFFQRNVLFILMNKGYHVEEENAIELVEDYDDDYILGYFL